MRLSHIHNSYYIAVRALSLHSLLIYLIIMLKDFRVSTKGSVPVWVTYQDKYSSEGFCFTPHSAVYVAASQCSPEEVNYVRKSIL